MKKNENNCRRSFLKKCTALTAGISIIGSNTNVIASPTGGDDWRWVGYCGVKCDNSCSWFSNDQCPGCKSISYNCTVQHCAASKRVPTCAHCMELLSCEDQYWINNPSKYDDIKDLQESLGITGIDQQKTAVQKIEIFPNPAQDFLKISNPDNFLMEYELDDINGRSIKKGMIDQIEFTLDISDLQSGNYIIKLKRNNIIHQTQQLIKL